MDSRDIKKKVRQFKKEYGIAGCPDWQVLESAFERQGFTIIEFSTAANDPDVETLIQSLKLVDRTSKSKGFLYADENFRLVFVNEKLSEEEKLIVLAHEEGHYYCGHMNRKQIIGHDVQEEYEANEFAHFLLHTTVGSQICHILSKCKLVIAFIALVFLVVCAVYFVSKELKDQQLYEGEYYVSEHGEKYHRKDCVTIEGHEVRRLTKIDIESGLYEPCGVCQPDKA